MVWKHTLKTAQPMCAVSTGGDMTGNDRRVMLGITFIFLESQFVHGNMVHGHITRVNHILSLGNFLVH